MFVPWRKENEKFALSFKLRSEGSLDFSIDGLHLSRCWLRSFFAILFTKRRSRFASPGSPGKIGTGSLTAQTTRNHFKPKVTWTRSGTLGPINVSRSRSGRILESAVNISCVERALAFQLSLLGLRSASPVCGLQTQTPSLQMCGHPDDWLMQAVC